LKFTVVIPTRERARTLGATLRTCVSQASDDLDILVSDNFSGDDTRAVVESFGDPRIRYVNTGARVSMTRNWEFALQHVREGYVTFIGDDDGLMPDAIRDVSELLRNDRADIVSWMKAEYCWPDHPIAAFRNRLSLPLSSHLLRVDAAKALRDVAHFWLPYARTPTLYNSFVSTAAIARTRPAEGPYFRSMAPDVYSGIVLLSAVDGFLYSLRPFSINGASAKSTGTSGYHVGADKEPIRRFLAELGEQPDFAFGHVEGSVMSVVAESLMQADHHRFGGRLRVNRRLALTKVVLEMAKKGTDSFAVALPEVFAIARRFGMEHFARIVAGLVRVSPAAPARLPLGLDARGILTVDAEAFSAMAVDEAALLASRLLGTYVDPGPRGRYRRADRVRSRLARALVARIPDRTL